MIHFQSRLHPFHPTSALSWSLFLFLVTLFFFLPLMVDFDGGVLGPKCCTFIKHNSVIETMFVCCPVAVTQMQQQQHVLVFRYSSLVTGHRAKAIISFCWVLSFGIGLTPMLGWNNGNSPLLSQFKEFPPQLFSKIV